MLHPKVSVPFAIVVVLAAAPFLWRASRVSGLPDLGEPFDVATAGIVTLPAGDNAYDDYEPASRLLVALPRAVDYDALDYEWSAIPETFRQWLESNRFALERWRAGSEKPEAVYVQPREFSINTLLPVIQEMRTFGRLARLEARKQRAEGDLNGAWTTCRALFRSSRHCGLHGCLIERLVGIALHDMAATEIDLWAREPGVTAEQLERALRELQADDRMTAPNSMSFQAEYFMFQNTVGMDSVSDLWDQMGPGSPPAPLRKAWMFLCNEPTISRRVAKQVYANWLDHVNKPLWERPAIHGGRLELYEPGSGSLPANRLPPERIEEYFQRAPLAQLVLPAQRQAMTAVTRERARQETLVLALAAYLHQRRNGSLPDSIEQLVEGKVLEAVLRDPFSRTGDPLHYRNDGASVVVWSLGENETDDGGSVTTSLPAKGRPGDIGYELGERPETPAEAEIPSEI